MKILTRCLKESTGFVTILYKYWRLVELNIIKKKQAYDEVTFTTRHTFYMFLLSVMGVITIASIFISSNYENVKTIIFGVGSGGIASVVVAWLIEIANTKRDNKKAQTNRNALFMQLKSILLPKILLAVVDCENLGEKIDAYEDRNWYEWLESAVLLSIKKDNDSRQVLRSYGRLFQDIQNTVHSLLDQTAVLLNQELLTTQNIFVLSAVESICKASDYVSVMKTNNVEQGKEYISLFKKMYEFMEKVPALKMLNDSLDDAGKGYIQLSKNNAGIINV